MQSNLIDCGMGVRLERGVRCRMRDGTELVSDHYYPSGIGPFPTLLMRQPYGRQIASTVVYNHPVWYAQKGFQVVIQDVRGRGDSAGEFYPFRAEAADGYDTIAWLNQHPACNGRIGLYGFSYQGLTQLLAAAEQPPGLVAIAPWMTAHDLYRGWFYTNGLLHLAATVGWGIQMLRGDALRLKLESESQSLETAWIDICAQTFSVPIARNPVFVSEKLPSYLRDWLANDRPGPFWTQSDVSSRLEQIRVPALHLLGWYDMFVTGSYSAYLALSGLYPDRNYLIAGPWVHLPWGDRIGESNFGSAALWNPNELLVRWFRHWLTDSGEFAEEPRIRHFVFGTNHWEKAAALESGTRQTLYLRSAGSANSRKGDGRLGSEPAAELEPRDYFVYDPEVPVLAPGGATAAAGCFDQSSIEQGNNILVYTSNELTQSWQILGEPRVVLFAVTSAPSSDLIAKLVRVTLQGRCDFICLGGARSTHLFGETYAADRVYRWEFKLAPTSCRFVAGDKIRLEIASSAFPLFDRNPGSAAAPVRATRADWVRSTQAILHNPVESSRLELPLVS